jgi:uncharacterized membrane protein YedE/YeeE
MSVAFFASVLISGALFGFGLSYATMIQPEVVLSFLRFDDFGLLWVLGSASLTTMVTYQLLPRLMRKPLFDKSFREHAASLDRNTLVGAAIFGLGWGISGVCPGPALAGLGVGNWPMLFTLAGIFAGAYVQGRMMKS